MTMTALQKLSNVKSQRMRLSLLQPPLPQFYRHDSFLHSKWFSFLFFCRTCIIAATSSHLLQWASSHFVQTFHCWHKTSASHIHDTYFSSIHKFECTTLWRFTISTCNKSITYFFSWHTFFAGDIISSLNWQTCNSDRYPTNHVWGRGVIATSGDKF